MSGVSQSISPWIPRLFSSWRGWRPAWLPQDCAAGLLLTAIAVPEQVATARLAGLPAEAGLIAFIAATVAFVIFGANRVLSAGADSTIAPIFAGGLAAISVAGMQNYGALAATLALMVGLVLVLAGLCRAGWIADLLSVPVTTGFLAGISVHIAVAELPGFLGVPGAGGSLLVQIDALPAQILGANPYALGIGVAAFLATMVTERLAPRLPGALLAMLLGGLVVAIFHWQARGVVTMDTLPRISLPQNALSQVSLQDVIRMAPLALIIALVCMMQTATVARAFAGDAKSLAPISPNFLGIGMGSIFAGLCGAFPVNASPPRTAVIVAGGGRSQFASLVSASCVLLLLLVGGSLFHYVPQSALAGILIAVAARLFRLQEIARIAKRGGTEIYLVAASILLVIAFPIEIGMLSAIALSLLQSIYSVARPRCVELARMPGTTVWWPPSAGERGETQPGVLAFAIAAPVNFTNVVFICRQLELAIAKAAPPLRLLVLEASGVVEIDYTGAKILTTTIENLRRRGLTVAMARLSAEKARREVEKTGLLSSLGADNVFLSVEEAIDHYRHVGKP